VRHPRRYQSRLRLPSAVPGPEGGRR
jgi:hypothetical protein